MDREMSISSVFDWLTKGATAVAAVAGTWAYLTRNADQVMPVVLTVWGLAYALLIALAALPTLLMELWYWSGPVYPRPSFSARLSLTRRRNGVPTKLEILERARRWDQVLTVLVAAAWTAVLTPAIVLEVQRDLRQGFPIHSWSVTWLLGVFALVGTSVALSSMLWVALQRQRRARRRKTCGSCGGSCPQAARVCSHCSEWFPGWKLLSPTVPPS